MSTFYATNRRMDICETFFYHHPTFLMAWTPVFWVSRANDCRVLATHDTVKPLSHSWYIWLLSSGSNHSHIPVTWCRFSCVEVCCQRAFLFPIVMQTTNPILLSSIKSEQREHTWVTAENLIAFWGEGETATILYGSKKLCHCMKPSLVPIPLGNQE